MEGQAAEILEIRASDAYAPLFLHFDHADLDAGPVGVIVENQKIRTALFKSLENLSLLSRP